MINYKDLMIGNWVYSSERTKFPMRVVNIGEDYCYLDFEGNEGDVWEVKDKDMMPIEVTEDMLLKIGFKDNTFQKRKQKIYCTIINGYTISISKHTITDVYLCEIYNNIGDIQGGIYDIKYLHELQNGIRLITKSDLEIKEL